jgi:hypothetical protein
MGAAIFKNLSEKHTPESTDRTVIIPPDGDYIFGGLSSGYSVSMPLDLNGLLPDTVFYSAIGQINDTVQKSWPPSIVQIMAYILAPFTFGVSLVLLTFFVCDIERNLRAKLKYLNGYFYEFGIKLVYNKKTCLASWLEVKSISDLTISALIFENKSR